MTTHPIPSSFRLRRRKWLVKRAKQGPRRYVAGTCKNKQIALYDTANGRRRTPNEQQKTFWHEITHAVLKTMGHKLWTNETFVTQFALLLEEMIRTARFEEKEE